MPAKHRLYFHNENVVRSEVYGFRLPHRLSLDAGRVGVAVAPLLALGVHDLLDVLLLELAVLVVAVGLVDGVGDGVEDVGALLEDVVHLLEGAEAGLGEEEVDAGEHKRVAERPGSAFSFRKKEKLGDNETYMTAKMI